MFSTLRRMTPREAYRVELPSFVSSLLVAEAFYRFHSFVLEAGAFLATWFVFGAGLAALQGLSPRRVRSVS